MIQVLPTLPPMVAADVLPSSSLSSPPTMKSSRKTCKSSATLSFIFRPRLCRRRVKPENKKKGHRYLKQRKGVSITKSKRTFRCKDRVRKTFYDKGKIVITSGHSSSSKDKYFEGEISKGSRFSFKTRSLSKLVFKIYDLDGTLFQVLHLDLCTRNRIRLGTYGSIKLVAFDD